MRKPLTIAFLLTALGIPLSSHAESIKKAIISNCVAATEEFRTLDSTKKVELVPYLRLILRLRLGGGEKRPGAVVSIDNRFGGLDSPFAEGGIESLWQSFEPMREQQAKRCALTFLTELGDRAFPALPDLVALAAQSSSDAEFQQQVDSAFDSVLRATTLTAETPADADAYKRMLREVLAALTPASEGYALDIFYQLRTLAIPMLVEEMKKPDSLFRDKLASIVKETDVTGEIVVPALLPLLEGSDDGLKKRALQIVSEYPLQAGKSAQAIFVRMNDLSPEVQHSAIHAFATIAENVPAEALSKENLAPLLRQFASAMGDDKTALIRAARSAMRHSAQFRQLIEETLRSPPSNIPAPQLLILFQERHSLSDSAYTFLLDNLYSKDGETRRAALGALSSYPERIKSTEPHLLKFFKNAQNLSIPDEKISDFRTGVLAAAALANSTSLKALLPYFVDALTISPEWDAEYQRSLATVFRSIGAPAVPSLMSRLQKHGIGQESRIIPLLVVAGAKDKSGASTIVSLLSSPTASTRVLTYNAIRSSLGSEGSNVFIEALDKVIRKNSEKKDSVAAVYAAALRANLLHASPNSARADVSPSEILLLQRLPELACTERILIVSQLPETAAYYQAYLGTLLPCLNETSREGKEFELDTTFKLLTAHGPLREESVARLAEQLAAHEFDKRLELMILASGKTLGLQNDTLAPLVQANLAVNDKAILLRTLNAAASQQVSSPEIVKQILAIIERSKDDEGILHAAVVAIAGTDRAAYPSEPFLLEEFSNEGYQWAEKSLGKVPVAITLEVLRKALQNPSDEVKLRAVRALGQLRSGAVPVLPNLRDLLQTKNSLLRREVGVSLLLIAPEDPDGDKWLRALLVPPSRKELLERKLSLKLRPALQRFSESGASEVQKQFITQLASRLLDTNT